MLVKLTTLRRINRLSKKLKMKSKRLKKQLNKRKKLPKMMKNSKWRDLRI